MTITAKSYSEACADYERRRRAAQGRYHAALARVPGGFACVDPTCMWSPEEAVMVRAHVGNAWAYTRAYGWEQVGEMVYPVR